MITNNRIKMQMNIALFSWKSSFIKLRIFLRGDFILFSSFLFGVGFVLETCAADNIGVALVFLT